MSPAKPLGLRLTLHTVSARQGLRWIALGWQVFRRSPLALSSTLALFLLAAMVLSLLGTAGALLGLAALPLLSLAYMLCTHQVLQKRPVSWQVFSQPFRLTPARSRAQLALALAYVVATVAVIAAAAAIDGGRFEELQRLMAESGQSEEARKAAEEALTQALTDSSLLWATLVRMGGLLLVSIPFWYAPALVHWGGQGALQALFSSTLGLWRNRNAFVLNGLGWLGILLASSLLLGLLTSLVGGPGLLALLVMPMTLLLASVFYCGLYFMFVDSFRFVADEGSSEPAPPQQPA